MESATKRAHDMGVKLFHAFIPTADGSPANFNSHSLNVCGHVIRVTF
jgi:hypothetical protein